MIDIDTEPTGEDRNLEENSLLSRYRFLKLGLLGGLSAATVLLGAACGGGTQGEDGGNNENQDGNGQQQEDGGGENEQENEQENNGNEGDNNAGGSENNDDSGDENNDQDN